MLVLAAATLSGFLSYALIDGVRAFLDHCVAVSDARHVWVLGTLLIGLGLPAALLIFFGLRWGDTLRGRHAKVTPPASTKPSSSSPS